MRWASNKLLHLELGIIQAVQTMGEVTLSEVIAAIGEGEAPSAAPRRAAAPAAAPQVASAPKMTPAPVPAAETVPTPKPIATTPAIREEPAPVTPPAPVAEPSREPVAAGDLWPLFLDKVHAERPLVSGWVELGALLSVEDKLVKLGLPTTESAARDNLLRVATRKFLEDILSELLARNITLEVVLDPSLKPPPATEVSFGFAELDSPAPAPAPAEKAGPVTEDKVEAATQPQAASAPPPDFYNDPLIQAALTKFKATLVTN
jgi:DNA polymerase-3 subunit gamma/tau